MKNYFLATFHDLILLRRSLSNLLTTLTAIIIILPCIYLQNLYSQTEDLERIRMLAEKAMSENNFPLAIKYHRQLRDILHDSREKAQISINIISMLIETASYADAEMEIEQFERNFASLLESDPIARARCAYFKAAVEISSGQIESAKDRLRSLIEPYPQPDKEFNCKILLSLAFCAIASEDWDSTLKYSKKIESEAITELWSDIGRVLKVVSLLQSGKDISLEIKKNTTNDTKLSEILHSYAVGQRESAITTYRKIDIEALKMNPSSVYSLWALSLVAMKNKDSSSAAIFLKDGLAIAKRGLLFLRLGILYAELKSSLGKTGEALEIYQNLRAEYPEYVRLSNLELKYADALFSDGQKEKAIIEYKKIIAEYPADISLATATRLAALLTASQDFSQAEELILQIPSIKSQSAKCNAAILSAELQFAKGEYLLAANLFAKIADEFPEMKDDALLGLIKSLYRASEFKKINSIMQDKNEDIAKSKHIQEILFLEAMTARRSARNDDAIRMLSAYVERYPNSKYAPDSLREVAEILMENGDYSSASAKFAELTAKYPDSELSLIAAYRKIHAEVLRGAFEIAEKDTVSISEKWPKSRFSAMAMIWLADQKSSAGEKDEADKIYAKIRDNFPEEKDIVAEALLGSAKIAFELNEHDKGFAILDELSEKFPDQPACIEGHFFRGDRLTEKNEYEKAIPFFLKASMKKPDSLIAIASYGRLGDCYLAAASNNNDDKEKILKAAEFYRKVVEATRVPIEAKEQALFKLGNCEEKLGDPGAALAKYRELMISFDVDWRRGFKRDTLWLAKAATAAIKIYLRKANSSSVSEAEKIFHEISILAPEAMASMRQNIEAAKEKLKK